MFSSLATGLNVLLTVLVIIAIIVALLFIIGGIVFYVAIVHPPMFKDAKPNKLMGKDFPALAHQTAVDTEKLSHLPSREVFVTTDDGLRLSAYMYVNPKPTDITVIGVHGYNSNGMNDYSSKTVLFLEAGYNVLMVNLRHAHDTKSEGKYIGFGVLEKNDMIKFVEYVNSIYPNGKVFLHGTSMGGATVMQASSQKLPNVCGIIEDCGFTSPMEEIVYQVHHMAHIPSFPLVNILNLYCKAFAKYSLSGSNSRDEVKKATVPILFIHGDDDAFVPEFMCGDCYESCTSPKEKYIVPGAAHAAACFKDPEKYMQVMNAFVEKYSWKDTANTNY